MQLFGDILHGASLSKFSFMKKFGKKVGSLLEDLWHGVVTGSFPISILKYCHSLWFVKSIKK